MFTFLATILMVSMVALVAPPPKPIVVHAPSGPFVGIDAQGHQENNGDIPSTSVTVDGRPATQIGKPNSGLRLESVKIQVYDHTYFTGRVDRKTSYSLFTAGQNEQFKGQDNIWAGTKGKSLAKMQFEMSTVETGTKPSIEYRVHQNGEWSNWVEGGTVVGSARSVHHIDAIQIREVIN